MKRRREAWYRNPFRLGGAGLVTLLAGYALLSSRDPEVVPSLLSLTGRLAFLGGLLAVIVSGTIWFLDARAPEPIQEEEEELPSEPEA